MAKGSIRLSINKNFPKATNHFQVLFKDFQGPPSFSRTFEALNLHLLNSSTFQDFQGPEGTLCTMLLTWQWKELSDLVLRRNFGLSANVHIFSSDDDMHSCRLDNNESQTELNLNNSV